MLSRIMSLTLKQMFDVTAKIVHNEEEINGLDNSVSEEFLDTIVIDQ